MSRSCELPAGMRSILTRSDGYGIAHVLGKPRAELDNVMAQHYLGLGGNSGYAFAVHTPDFEIVGGALIGGTASVSCDRSLIASSHPVRAIKRSFIRDHIPNTSTDHPLRPIPVPESQLLRACVNAVADILQTTVMIVSYADPAAIDLRTSKPLLGGILFSAGFMMAGWTKRPRYVAIDESGCARSTRQGGVTLTSGNIRLIRPGWRLVTAPKLRVWLAVVPPHYHIRDGKRRKATSAWRRREWHRAWAALNPERQLACKQWIKSEDWSQLLANGQRPLVEHGRDGKTRPLQTRADGVEQRQPAWWSGHQLCADATPIWVPELVQETMELVDEATALDERTANRAYLPRLYAASSV